MPLGPPLPRAGQPGEVRHRGPRVRTPSAGGREAEEVLEPVDATASSREASGELTHDRAFWSTQCGQPVGAQRGGGDAAGDEMEHPGPGRLDCRLHSRAGQLAKCRERPVALLGKRPGAEALARRDGVGVAQRGRVERIEVLQGRARGQPTASAATSRSWTGSPIRRRARRRSAAPGGPGRSSPRRAGARRGRPRTARRPCAAARSPAASPASRRRRPSTRRRRRP